MITSDIAVTLVSGALKATTLMAAVLIIPNLIVGVIVSLFQAATQINEQTLSFLPRLLTTLTVLGLAGHWISQYLMDYSVAIFQRAALLVH